MIFYDRKKRRKTYFRLFNIGLIFVLLFSIFDLGQSLAGTYHHEIDYDHRYYFDNYDHKKLALTFDDGPDPDWTPAIVRILEEKQVPATFFLLGEHIIKHKELVRQLYEKGFELGNHTFTHSENVHDSAARLKFELNLTNKLIEEITGHSAILYRPPYLMNVGNDPLFMPEYPEEKLAWAEQAGFIAVGADIDPKDWLAVSADDIAQKLYSDIKNGHIILLHDGAYDQSNTIAALPGVIDRLQGEGYEFVTVSNLLGLEPSQVMPPVNASKGFWRGWLDSFYFQSLSTGAQAFIIILWLLVLAILLRLFFVLCMLMVDKIGLLKTTPAISRSSFAQSVSVLIPAYNEEKSIADTVQSVINNKGPIGEIIVINDGSSDETAAIVQALSQKHAGLVKLISKQNSGKAEALNTGLRAAQHDIVMAMDGDTILAPDAIEYLLRHFHDRRVAAVAGKVRAIRAGNVISAFQTIEYIIGQNMEKRVMAMVNAVGVVPGPIGAWRRDLLLELGGYSTDTLVEDQDLTLAILAQGYKIRYEPQAIAYTETPDTVRNFVRQRFRWIFGTMQCFWKYKRLLFSAKRWNVGWIVMPNIVLYNTLVPLFSPIIDILALISILNGNLAEVLLAYNLFTVFDLAYAYLGFRGEKNSQNLLLLIPLQRLYYRQLLLFVIIKSLIRAIEGTGALWNKIERKGYIRKYYHAALGS